MTTGNVNVISIYRTEHINITKGSRSHISHDDNIFNSRLNQLNYSYDKVEGELGGSGELGEEG